MNGKQRSEPTWLERYIFLRDVWCACAKWQGNPDNQKQMQFGIHSLLASSFDFHITTCHLPRFSLWSYFSRRWWLSALLPFMTFRKWSYGRWKQWVSADEKVHLFDAVFGGEWLIIVRDKNLPAGAKNRRSILESVTFFLFNQREILTYESH